VKLTGKKAILFDLDGTLIDSVPDLALALNMMLKSLGRDTFSEETIRYWVGNGAQILVKRALLGNRNEKQNVDDALFKTALKLFLNFYGTDPGGITAIYPGVPETLEAFRKKDYKLAIVTNKPYLFVGPILKNLHLDHFFEFWVGGDSLPQKKPDPALLFHASEKMDLPVEECIMVGDSKNDILAANAAGMQSIGVTYGYNYGEDISLYGPDVIVDDFSDILSCLES